MAAFQRILHLIVLSGFALPGLSLSPSPAATALWSSPVAQRIHPTNQKQSGFPRKLERETIVGLGEYSGKAEGLELDGDAGGGDPDDDGYMEQKSPVEQVEHRHLVEGSKGQRWIKGKSGGNDATVWGKTMDASTGLQRKEKNDGETSRTEAVEKEKRKWGDNNMRVWGKRTGNGKEDGSWDEESTNAWNERTSTDADKRKWGDNSMSVWGKRSADDEKRRWGDNSMSVWGKRSDGDKETSGHSSTSGKDGKSVGAYKEDGGETWLPNGVRQEKIDAVKNTGDNHRILHKRSILDPEENSVNKQRYDWLVQELSKRNRPHPNPRGRQYGGPKRNWETNTMKVWGKRGLVWNAIPDWDNYLDEESKDGKRSWTSDNAIRVWGKRSHPLEDNEIGGLPMYDQ